MCGRFTLQITKEMLAAIFGASSEQDIQPRYNIAPTQQVVAIRTYPDGNRHMVLLKWGLIPSWSKDPTMGAKMINARSETVDVKPAFKGPLKYHRCIIPADGFYEWKTEEGKKKPLYVKLKNNRLMLFAGLWDHWKASEGNVIESCTILTTSANDLIKPLHDRMPVILDTKDIDIWLNPHTHDPEQLKPLFKPYSSSLMEMYPVSDLVNSPKNDNPSCLAPL